MVALIGDQQSEAVADKFDIEQSRIVGADSYFPDIPAAAAEHAALYIEKFFNTPAPLDKKIDRRH